MAKIYYCFILGLVSPNGTIQTNISQAPTDDPGLDHLSEARSTNGVSSTTDAKVESPKIKSKKSKRRNTLSAHLQARRDMENQQQEMITSSVSVSDDHQINAASNQMMNLPGGQFMANQNMMLNPVMMPGTNQLLMPGMIGGMMANNQSIMGNQGLVGNKQGVVGNNQGLLGSQQTLLANSQNEINLTGSSTNKTLGDESEAGLLQLAMQDAGITPQSSSQASQSEETGTVSTSASTVAEVPEQTSNTSQTSALQTLASVATNTQGLSVGSESSASQVGAASSDTQASVGNIANPSAAASVNSNLPVMTSGPTGYQTVVQNGQVLNMPLVGNQPVLQGQQQVMFINEQGIPVIANMPVGMDPNNQGNQLLNNMQKQVY